MNFGMVDASLCGKPGSRIGEHITRSLLSARIVSKVDIGHWRVLKQPTSISTKVYVRRLL